MHSELAKPTLSNGRTAVNYLLKACMDWLLQDFIHPPVFVQILNELSENLNGKIGIFFLFLMLEKHRHDSEDQM